MEIFIVFHFLKAVFDTSFRFSQISWFQDEIYQHLILLTLWTLNQPVCSCKWWTTLVLIVSIIWSVGNQKRFKLIIENNWIDPPHWSLSYDIKDLSIRIPFIFHVCHTCNTNFFYCFHSKQTNLTIISIFSVFLSKQNLFSFHYKTTHNTTHKS